MMQSKPRFANNVHVNKQPSAENLLYNQIPPAKKAVSMKVLTNSYTEVRQYLRTYYENYIAHVDYANRHLLHGLIN